MSLHAWNLFLVRKMKRDIGLGQVCFTTWISIREERKLNFPLTWFTYMDWSSYSMNSLPEQHNKIEGKTDVVS